MKIEVLEACVSVVQVVHPIRRNEAVHNLHNQKPVFEYSNFLFLITAAAKTARGDLAQASGTGRGHTQGA